MGSLYDLYENMGRVLIIGSMIPESPRFLISHDHREEAYHILVKYHAEGDSSSRFVAAEMAQIEHTIRIELDNSRRSWAEMITVPGIRKRVIIGAFLGIFTQWSGNTLLSYYINDILKLIGFSDQQFKGKLNVGLNSWNLVSAVTISLLVRRFPRRKMYLICATSLLCCYIAWTIAVQKYQSTKRIEPARLVIAIIFIYQACYNIGYNALTYSESSDLRQSDISLIPRSFLGGAVSVRAPCKGHYDFPILRSFGSVIYDVVQSNRP